MLNHGGCWINAIAEMHISTIPPQLRSLFLLKQPRSLSDMNCDLNKRFENRIIVSIIEYSFSVNFMYLTMTSVLDLMDAQEAAPLGAFLCPHCEMRASGGAKFWVFLSCRVVDHSFNQRDWSMPPPLLSLTFSPLYFIQGLLSMRRSIWKDRNLDSRIFVSVTTSKTFQNRPQ